MKRATFSCCWSEELGEEIKSRCDEDYPITFGGGQNPLNFQCVRDVVNQGIDSHLEAIFFKESGRTFTFRKESVPVLVRRLLENNFEDEEKYEEAILLASGICETLGIELL